MRDRFLWIGCLLYAVIFAALGALKYDVHRNLVDFGIFAQTIASAFRCFCNPIEGSHWAFHFSPILYPMGLLVALARTPLTLIATQAIAGALVAPPIYALALRIRGDRRIARLAATTVWLYPPLAGLIFGDFHENGFAPAAVAWTLYAFEAGSIPGTIVGAIVTLSIKEDQAVFLAIAGAIGAFAYRGTTRGRVAAAIAVVSVLIFAGYFAFIQPRAANAEIGWQPWRFYAYDAADASGFFATILARLGFLVLIFGPLLFLPLRSPAIVLAVAPLAEVLFSRMPTTYTVGTHYAGAWIGYVLFAFALALRKVSPARAAPALGGCIALCLLVFAVADPLHPGLNLRRYEARDTALDAFLRRLPRGAGVATQEEAYTHLALYDPDARLLPEVPWEDLDACFVLLDYDFPDSPRLREFGNAFARTALARGYLPIVRSGSILLYRRLGACD